jgi:hypothetical protein
MKLLLENWRKYLLTEAAMTVDDLMNFKDEEFPDQDLEIYILARNNHEGGTEFWYASLGSRGDPYMLGYNDPISGHVEIVPYEDGEHAGLGPCHLAWQVKYASAADKWGPLLYDVAMEYATMWGHGDVPNSGGLIADRDQVSDEARAVWDYYLGRRGDVDHHQLDDLKNTLTPEIEVDNCDQYIASVGGKYDWVENSLSKRYTKKPTTISRLKELGRFIDQT